ncbi:sulfur carrier protein ThiS [uncultured Helicobacter sp.]|uniref:sulfur carrier protein ThiS n=1 Tax=Helicobacter sp. TaxID=218 RepID=UPI00374FAD94|nr:sulfur carrier protein ThiS [Helicobacter sp.]
MQIILNGESYTTTAQSIAELIKEVGVREKMIVLAQNTAVIQAKDWDSTPLCENDEIEILQFMGGG